MKNKSIFSLILSFLLFLTINDISLATDMKAGIKFGLNVANIYEAWEGKTVDYDSKVGYSAGLFYSIEIIRELAIQPEILFSKKGGKTTYTWWGAVYQSSISLSYIEIPILVKFIVPTQSSSNPVIFFGPSLGIKLGGKEKIESEESSWEEKIGNLKTLDFGLIFGAGLDLGEAITVDIRYNLGLTNINKNAGNDSYAKNRVLSITLGYSFTWMME